MKGLPASLAKTSTPRLFGVVPRERLFARLDENRGRPLIWIQGPPGAGKTALAASYLDARGIPCLWYQVDDGDADPANLFHYLTIAAESFLGEIALPLPRLVAEHGTDLPAFSRSFFRELFRRLPAGIVLVLDNYQEVPRDASMHDIVRAAVGEVSPGSSIIGVSRFGTPGSFAQLIGGGVLFSLRWEALRLTLEETRALSEVRAVRDDWLVRALHQQSEGWAAGITLMLERLGQREADARELTIDTRESVFDYFASLLFEHTSEASRELLLSLSFLPYVSASMALRLTGREEGGALLEDLYRRNLFTDRRPGIEPVYQFHAMFRDFLQRRARTAKDPPGLLHLLRQSARTLADCGDVEAAIPLHFAAGDWTGAVPVILGAAHGLMKSARRQTLEAWIGALPSELLDANPRLLYWQGIAQVDGDPGVGLVTLSRARDLLSSSTDRVGRIQCLAALLKAAQLGHAAIPFADAWLGELLEQIEAADADGVAYEELATWSAIVAVLPLWRPWHALTTEARVRVQDLLRQQQDPTEALAAAASALVSDLTAGGLQQGEELVSLIEPIARDPRASPSARAWFLFGVAYLRFVQARYEDALCYFDLAIEVAEASGLKDALSDIRLYRVMVAFRTHGWDRTDAGLREIEADSPPRRPMSLALLRIYQARRAHHYGRWTEAAELAVASDEAIRRVGAPQNLMSFGLFNAEVLIGAGRMDEARPLLRRSIDVIARSPELACWRPAAMLCEAFLACRENRLPACAALLTQALSSAGDGIGKYYLRYMECSMPPMFSLALCEGIQVELVQQLIRMFRLRPPADAPDRWPRPIRIRTLGRFEVEVNDKPLEFSRKVPKKTLALLKALVAYRHEDVPEQWLCDALWGDEEADAARQVLGVTVMRLRKLLGSDEAVGHQGGKVWLDRHLCWVDAWRFEAALEEPMRPERMRGLLDLYAGSFLPEDDDQQWSVAMRERIRGKFIHALATHGQALEASCDLEDAARLYLRGIDADVVVEGFHRGLMRCYWRMGRLTEAVSAYRRLRQTLSAVLGVRPSAESEAIYRDVMRELAAAPRPDATSI